MALLYTGYAQARGFDPINPSDTKPEKIRKQGLRAQEGMEKQINWNNKQATRITNALQENARAEQKNRISNFKLRQEFNRMYAQAELDHGKSQVKKSVDQLKLDQAVFDDILKFTQTGAKLLGQQIQKQQDTNKALWKDNVRKYGIDTADLEEVNSYKRGLWNSSMETTAVFKRLREQGTPEDIIRSLHGLDGYLQVTIKEADAVTKTRQLGSWYEKHANTPLPIGGDTITFNAAYASGDPVKLQEALRQLDLLIDEERGPIDAKTMESSGSYKIRDQIHASYFRNQLVISKKKAAETNYKRLLARFDGEAVQQDEDGQTIHIGQAFLNTIALEAGANPSRVELSSARSSVISMLSYGLESGTRRWDDVKEILNYSFVPHGSKQETTIGDHWGDDRNILEKAKIANLSHENKVAGIDLQRRQNAKKIFTGDLYFNLYPEDGSEPDEQYLFDKYQAAVDSGYTEAAQMIQSYIANSGLDGDNDQSGLLYIQTLSKQGKFIDTKLIKDLNLSPSARIQAAKFISLHNKVIPTAGEGGTGEQLEEWVNRSLETMVPSKSAFQKDPTSLWAKRKALNLGNMHYKAHLTKHGLDKHEDALQYAKDMLAQDFKGSTFKVDYDPNARISNFVGGRANLERDTIDLNFEAMSQAIRDNPIVLDEQEFVPYSALVTDVSKSNQGAYNQIPLVQILSNQTGIDPLDIKMRQIAMHNKTAKEKGISEIPEYSDEYIKTYNTEKSKIKPNQFSKLNSDNPTTINSAYANSEQPIPYIDRNIDAAGERLRSRLTGMIGYNSIDDGNGLQHSNDALDFHLTNATVGQVIQMNLRKAGAYHLTSEQIKKYAPLVQADMADLFTADIQDKLFEAVYRSEGIDNWLDFLEESSRVEEKSQYDALSQPFQPRHIAWVRPELHYLLQEQVA